MTEDLGRTSALAGSGGPMAERMQALLARAAEDQLTEQRQVSVVLTDLRGLVQGLSEQLRGTASSARLDSLGGEVSSLLAELRSATSGLGERLDQLGRRVDEHGTTTTELMRSSGSGAEAVAVRVSALGNDVTAQGESLDRLATSIDALSAFPDALAALQREVSGLHDRLAPLSEVRSGLADLAARTGAVEALRPEILTVVQKLDEVATGEDLTRSRDSLLGELAERLDRLESAAARPVLTSGELGTALDPMRTRLDGLSEPILERVGAVDQRLSELETRLASVGDDAGGVPAVAQDLARVASRVEGLDALREDVAGLRTGVSALQDDSPLPALALAVAGLREDVEDVGGRVADLTVPTADAVAAAVTQQVSERLVGQLAPRVADLVLTRVAATLVAQVSGSVTSSVQEGLTERVRAAGADSERRINAHVDEAVLALAEALLRRRRGGARPGAGGGLVLEDEGPADLLTPGGEDETAVIAPAALGASGDEREGQQGFASASASTVPDAADDGGDVGPDPEYGSEGDGSEGDGLVAEEPDDADTAAPGAGVAAGTPSTDTAGTGSPDVLGARSPASAPASPIASVTTSPAPRLFGRTTPVVDPGASGASQPQEVDPAPADASATDRTGSASSDPDETPPASAAVVAPDAPDPGADAPHSGPPASSTAPAAPAFTTFTVPRAIPPPGQEAAEDAVSVDEFYEDEGDEDADGQRRRPWWRPGG